MKLTLNDVGNLTDTVTAQSTINTNNASIKTAFENTLSRDGTNPNQMENSLDMNGKQILNLPIPVTSTSPLRLADLSSFLGTGTVNAIPIGGTAGQALKKNTSTNYDVSWGNSVISVGLSLPGDFTITGSPVTSAGTLGATFTSTPTGTGGFVRAVSPSLVTPALGTPISGVATNLTGTAAGLTAGNVTTNANLTGNVTSVGNATTLASTIVAGGPTGSATVAPIITYDAKGRLTTVSSATVTPAVGSVTGLGTGVSTALGVNVGLSGAVVTNSPALTSYTPTFGTGTSGSFTSTITTASYVDVGPLRYYIFNFTINTISAPVGYLSITLPGGGTVVRDVDQTIGRNTSNGAALSLFGFAGATFYRLVNFNTGAFPAAAGDVLSIQFVTVRI